MTSTIHRRPVGRRTVAATVACLLVLASCSSGAERAAPTTKPATDTSSAPSTATGGEDADCATTVDAEAFASEAELRELTTELTSFGLRSPGSTQHEKELAWLEDELRAIPGMEVRDDPYTIDRWQPTPEAPGSTPGRDLGAAGGLTVDDGGSTRTIPVAGAVPFTLPTTDEGQAGQLVYLPADQEITASNAKGKVIVRETPPGSIPYGLFSAIAHYVTPDLPTEGDYERPYLRPFDQTLIDAGKADAAGVIFLWEVPTEQVRGYWDPHTGTRFSVPAVFAGNEQAAEIKRLATEGRTANVIVRATWDEAETHNIIASLPGQSRERIVINSHTDGNTWVQENGPVGVLALARYLGGLPERCRQRDIEIALTSDHLGFTEDGTFAYGAQLDEDYDKGTVAVVLSMEHLGSREILPSGPDNRLDFTGLGDPIAWSAPSESPTLVDASIDAVKRRGLTRAAVLKGVGVPDTAQVPQICSQGGIGTNFNSLLIPTVAVITGPWSLWAPSFGEQAIDFGRMRSEVLAMGDVARTLDGTSSADIAGSFVEERRQRSQGMKTCDLVPPPAVAPAS